MIVLEGVRKSFGKVEALRGVSFEVGNGQITGLLGPNGAGKTTALRTIYGVVTPDAGRVHVDGVDLATDRLEAQRRLGILPHAQGLYSRLTAREHILYFSELHGMARAVRALLLKLREEGRCVLFSSHVMQEVSALCDRVVVIARGQVVAEGTPEELRRATGKGSLEDAFVAAIGSEEGLE
jgi:sodium transport system ATP-binding protein